MKHRRSGKGNQGRNHDFFFLLSLQYQSEPPQEVRQQRKLRLTMDFVGKLRCHYIFLYFIVFAYIDKNIYLDYELNQQF